MVLSFSRLRPVLMTVGLAALVQVGGAPLARAEPTTSTEAAKDAPAPKPWLEEKIRAAKALADRRVDPDSPKAEAWKREAQALIDDMVDWEAMISRSLGSRWSKLSERERNKFYELMRSLIRASFQSKLRLALQEKDQKPGRVKIDWRDEVIREDEANLVARVSAGRDRVDLEFDLIRQGDGWRLTDLTIDGASTVRLYRSSFRQVMREEGWDGLISRLEKKLADVEAGRADFVPGQDGRSG